MVDRLKSVDIIPLRRATKPGQEEGSFHIMNLPISGRLSGVSFGAALALAGLAAVSLPAAPAEARSPARPAKKAAAPASTPAAPAPVTVTKDGAVQVGRATAKHILAEYISYTCPHCAHFAQESAAPLKADYIAKGKVRVEYRNLVRDPFDFAAALLAHCGTPAQFVGNHDYLLANQQTWMGNAEKATPAQQNGWMQGTYTQRLTAIAQDIGLITMMQKRGITPAKARTCLADEARQAQLLAMTEGAAAVGVDSTPSFLLDGRKLENAHDWASVKAALDAAS